LTSKTTKPSAGDPDSPRPRKPGTTPKAIKSVERKLTALDLRKRGLTLAQIGERLGITKQSVHELISAALKESISESVDEIRAIEAEKLDALEALEWQRIYRDPPAREDYANKRDHDRALASFNNKRRKIGPHVALILKIMTRRAKLLGLDTPSRSTVGLLDMSGWSDEEIETFANGGPPPARTRGAGEAPTPA
jgi:transcriptional regulator with XRE-family HTH domain